MSYGDRNGKSLPQIHADECGSKKIAKIAGPGKIENLKNQHPFNIADKMQIPKQAISDQKKGFLNTIARPEFAPIPTFL